MKNNKGFSTIELVVSFSICMVVVVVLFQIVLSLKELYEKSVVKTEFLSKQNLVVEQIYTDIYEKGLSTVEQCDEHCAKFTFDDGTEKELNFVNSKLTYGEYTTTMNNTSFVGKIYIDNSNFVWIVQLVIRHKLFSNDEDFGVRIVHYTS